MSSQGKEMDIGDKYEEVMDTEDIIFEPCSPMKWGKMDKKTILEKMVDKNFYNDFGDIFDPDVAPPEQ
ncbi:hypothetical protein Ddc_02869 [Ditylenchus destructor]|nr:hypothetical protein Ddc_02869 [Ditylenchus destructor]